MAANGRYEWYKRRSLLAPTCLNDNDSIASSGTRTSGCIYSRSSNCSTKRERNMLPSKHAYVGPTSASVGIGAATSPSG